MKKSISIWSFSSDHDLTGKMRLAREAGFAGFEIDLSDNGPLTPESTPADAAAVVEMSRQAGLELSGLATGLYWGTNPVSADAATRQRAQAILHKQIELAAALGLDAILVVPGAVGTDFIPGSEEVPYDVAWERATAFIAEAEPLAETQGVRICIENVWNKFLLSPLEMKRFIEQFDSEFVRCYFDTGNVLAFGYPEQWIRILGELIYRVHVKDYRRAVGTINGFVDLLSGDTNWPAVRQALRDIGYDGWLTAEMLPPYRYSADTLIHNTSRAMDGIIQMG